MSTGRSTTVRDQHRRAIRRTKPPCGICGGEIDYTLPHTDPGAFVVDHVIPLNRGGLDTLDNKTAAHRSCNRTKSDTLPGSPDREVVLICGPPGAGKTTYARSLGLTVYDIDDPMWNRDEAEFRQAVNALANNIDARAAVIRSGATISARRKAAATCGATRVVVIETEASVCVKRIQERKRPTPPIRMQVAAARDWWEKYEPGDIGLTSTPGARQYATARSW